jgi:Yip1-like protein
MDFTILYRVILKPNDTFKEFKDRTRPEPFIIIALFVVLSTIATYKHDVLQTNEQPSLILIRMLQTLFFIFIFTGIYSLIILLSAKLLFKVRTRFPILLSALMLCSLPKYLLSLPMIYLESIARYIGLLGFIWVVFLWHAALSQILPVSKRQAIILLAVLVLTSIVVYGIWGMVSIAIFNIYNPAT